MTLISDEVRKKGGPSLLMVMNLLSVLRRESMNQTNLCRKAGISYGCIIKVMDYLLAWKVVTVEKRVNEDGRSSFVILTEKGTRLVDAFIGGV